jgi:hypothetical protein
MSKDFQVSNQEIMTDTYMENKDLVTPVKGGRMLSTPVRDNHHPKPR